MYLYDVIPMETKNDDKFAEEGANATEKSYGWVAALILAVIIVAGLSYGYNTVTEKNRLVMLCNEYASSPDLKFPTTCVPFKGDSNYAARVDELSAPLCKCTVDLGNGTSTVIDVRVSK
jgi:hypothetical protein